MRVQEEEMSIKEQLKEAPRKHQEKGIHLACLAHLGPEQVHIYCEYWGSQFNFEYLYK